MRTESFKDFAERISSIKTRHTQRLIGIDGGGGSGKSTFAKLLQAEIPGSAIIHGDDFYKGPWDKRLDHTHYEVNPYFDWDRFYTEVLEPVTNGIQIQYRIYDWKTDLLGTEKIAVPLEATIIVEGGFTTQDRFSDLYDFKIWIEADEAMRLDLALTRDGEHMRFLWEEDWLPVERNYIHVQNPAERADLVVKGHSKDFSEGLFEVMR